MTTAATVVQKSSVMEPEPQQAPLPAPVASRLRCRDGIWWPGTELNRRHRDFQSRALPTELPGLVQEFSKWAETGV
jgi:hypothetical protein